jgi:hypothetical protein
VHQTGDPNHCEAQLQSLLIHGFGGLSILMVMDEAPKTIFGAFANV